VNPEFRLHGCKNIYCADSSVFPNAPGINPVADHYGPFKKSGGTTEKGWQPMKISRYFNRNQLIGLRRAGDVIIPGTDVSPLFRKPGASIMWTAWRRT
jgi:hypothetical protein